MKKTIVVCVVALLILFAYFFGKPMVASVKQAPLIKSDDVILTSFLKENNLKGAVIQNVNPESKSTISLVKSDGTVKEIFNWTDGGTNNCGFSYLSDCSNRASILTRFNNSSVPVDVYTAASSVHYFDYPTTRNSPSVDLSQYFPENTNTIHLQGFSDNFSPDGKFVFSAPVLNSPYYKDGGMVLSRVDYVSSKYTGTYGTAGAEVSVMPKISSLGIAWTPDSKYLIYEYQNSESVDRNATAKIDVYSISTNTQTELVDSFPLTTIVGALSNNTFIEAKGDGTYVASITNGVVSEVKLLSSVTKLVGLVF